MEVIIAKDKKLNVFWPGKNGYVRSYESKMLDKYEFNQLLDFHRTPEGSLVLTDKFLMLVPLAPRGGKLAEVKEKIVLQLEDPNETFFSVQPFYNSDAKRLDAYLISLLKKDKTPQVCFRKLSEEKPERKCKQLKEEDSLVDVVFSGMFIYVEVEGGAVILDNKLEVLERIDSQPTQYFSGFVSIGDHQLYAAHAKTTHDSRIIIGRRDSGKLLTLKVEDTLMTVQKMVTGKETTF